MDQKEMLSRCNPDDHENNNVEYQQFLNQYNIPSNLPDYQNLPGQYIGFDGSNPNYSILGDHYISTNNQPTQFISPHAPMNMNLSGNHIFSVRNNYMNNTHIQNYNNICYQVQSNGFFNNYIAPYLSVLPLGSFHQDKLRLMCDVIISEIAEPIVETIANTILYDFIVDLYIDYYIFFVDQYVDSIFETKYIEFKDNILDTLVTNILHSIIFIRPEVFHSLIISNNCKQKKIEDNNKIDNFHTFNPNNHMKIKDNRDIDTYQFDNNDDSQIDPYVKPECKLKARRQKITRGKSEHECNNTIITCKKSNISNHTINSESYKNPLKSLSNASSQSSSMNSTDLFDKSSFLKSDETDVGNIKSYHKCDVVDSDNENFGRDIYQENNIGNRHSYETDTKLFVSTSNRCNFIDTKVTNGNTLSNLNDIGMYDNVISSNELKSEFSNTGCSSVINGITKNEVTLIKNNIVVDGKLYSQDSYKMNRNNLPTNNTKIANPHVSNEAKEISGIPKITSNIESDKLLINEIYLLDNDMKDISKSRTSPIDSSVVLFVGKTQDGCDNLIQDNNRHLNRDMILNDSNKQIYNGNIDRSIDHLLGSGSKETSQFGLLNIEMTSNSDNIKDNINNRIVSDKLSSNNQNTSSNKIDSNESVVTITHKSSNNVFDRTQCVPFSPILIQNADNNSNNISPNFPNQVPISQIKKSTISYNVPISGIITSSTMEGNGNSMTDINTPLSTDLEGIPDHNFITSSNLSIPPKNNHKINLNTIAETNLGLNHINNQLDCPQHIDTSSNKVNTNHISQINGASIDKSKIMRDCKIDDKNKNRTMPKKGIYKCHLCNQPCKNHICTKKMLEDDKMIKRLKRIRPEEMKVRKRQKKNDRKTNADGLKVYKCSKCGEIKGRKHICETENVTDIILQRNTILN